MTTWTRDLPTEEGWYWIRYVGKNGQFTCPCRVTVLKQETCVMTSLGDYFTDKTRKVAGFSTCLFGPRIPEPED